MFLPTGDTPNPRNFTPWVNYTLLALNIAVFILVSLPLSLQPADPGDPAVGEYLQTIRHQLPPQVSPDQVVRQLRQYDLFVFEHGYKPGRPSWGALLFSLFLHGGWMHLLGNMLFLWIYGDNVEHRLGRFGYLAAYLLCGVAATLFFALFARGSLTPLVGASGAISGVLGLYFLLFPRNQVKVFVFLFPFLMDVFLLPARWVLGVYLVIDNLLPFVAGSSSGVAHGAHIGGFLAGLLIARYGEQWSWQWPWSGRVARRPATEQAPPDPPDMGPARLRQALREGDAAAALRTAAELDLPQLAALPPAECVRLAGWLEEAGYAPASGRLLRACLGRRPEQAADLYLQLGLLRLRQGQASAAYQHLLDALDHDPSEPSAARARAALAQIDVYRRRR